MVEEAACNPVWSFQGMTALVTVGTKGIGHAVVEELTRFGAMVYTCSRNEDELNACLTGWTSKGFRVAGSVCDVSYGPQREKLMDTLSSELNGKLNILVGDRENGNREEYSKREEMEDEEVLALERRRNKFRDIKEGDHVVADRFGGEERLIEINSVESSLLIMFNRLLLSMLIRLTSSH